MGRQVTTTKTKARQGRRKGKNTADQDRSTRCLTFLTQNVRGLAKTDGNLQKWFGGFRKHHGTRQVDVTFLQETRAHNGWARQLHDAHERAWGREPRRNKEPFSFWQQPERAAGGVAILLHPRSALVNAKPLWEEQWTSEFMAIVGEFEGEQVTLINIYGSSSSKDAREALFHKIRTLGRPKGIVILGGDFNCVLDRELDRSRLTAGSPESAQLQALLDEWQLTDAAAEHQLAIYSEADKRRFYADHHTYRYAHGDSDIASSRLDRWYIPTPCLHRLTQLQVTPPLNRSDHDAVWMRVTEASPPFRARQATTRRALKYPMTEEAKGVVAEVAALHLTELAAHVDAYDATQSAGAWDAAKTTTKAESLVALRLQRKKIKRAYRQRRHRLRAHLRSLQLGPGPVLPTVSSITEAMAAVALDRQEQWRRVRAELVGLSEAEALRQRQRAFAAHAGTGADAARAFYARISTKFHQRPRARTGIDGPRMAKDWQGVTQRGPMDPVLQDEFFKHLPAPRARIRPDSFLLPFSETEIAAAIAACPRGKACGPDGLPNDWYRDNAALLTPLLTKLFNKWYTAGVLPPSFSGATIFCIPKKPAPKTGLDFRPIALLNTDYKIFSRVLLNRVQKHLEQVVSSSQFGFVPDRQVHDALDVWTAISAQVAAGTVPQTTTAILLDFAKAYDTLDRRFLSLALRRLGFPGCIVQAVEVMHLATTAVFLAEDRLSADHAILNGIRQGCPFAPVLFVLAVDTLYDQLAATPDIAGISLPSGTSVTAVGFADDTTVYLSNPKSALPLRRELDLFAAASASGWDTETGEIGFPKLPADQMARALGAQVSSALNVDAVWDLTIKQLKAKLILAQVRTTDVLQRAQVAQAIIVPKVMYIGRHVWPTAGRIRALQKMVNNYVWHGLFVEECQGRAWMNHDSAILARRDGGIGLPDLASDFLQLSVSTHLRWGERATGLRGEVGELLSGRTGQAGANQRPHRHSRPGPGLRATLAATGAAITASQSTQVRLDEERRLSGELLKRVGRGTTATRWWGGDWFFTDHHDAQPQLLELRTLQTAEHGSFNFHGLMAARICGDGVLLEATGRQVQVADFPGIRCSRLTTLKTSCESSQQQLTHGACGIGKALVLISSGSPARASTSSWARCTLRDVTAKVRRALDEPTARALDHAWLCPLRTIWHERARAGTKASTKRHIRAAKTLRGKRENEARGRRLTEANALIGGAQERRAWKDIDTFHATTSRQRLKLRQLKGNRIQGWDRLHHQHGCPHCAHDRDGGSIPHIFWQCGEAQALWQFLLSAWDDMDIWKPGLAGAEQRQQAIFDMHLPAFPRRLWKLPDLASISKQDSCTTILVHDTLQTAWQQQVLTTKAVIWKWRHNIEDDAQQWSLVDAKAYLIGSLQATTRGLLDRLPRDPRLRDPRRQLRPLRHCALASRFDGPAQDPAGTVTVDTPTRVVLFFDGGSRGNPGPGGAGAVLVKVDPVTAQPSVIWSACMAYQQAGMTNNQAEYLGAIAGLREAKDRGLQPEVVGDSALILRQLRLYRPPKNAKLRPLYSEARRLADEVRVEVWQHHRRAYNKMADAAANAAMDLRISVQVSHPSEWPHTATIDDLLSSDFQEWHTRHLLRTEQD